MLKESQSEVARLRQQLEVLPGASELAETQDVRMVRMSVWMRVCRVFICVCTCVHVCVLACVYSWLHTRVCMDLGMFACAHVC